MTFPYSSSRAPSETLCYSLLKAVVASNLLMFGAGLESSVERMVPGNVSLQACKMLAQTLNAAHCSRLKCKIVGSICGFAVFLWAQDAYLEILET